MNHFRPYNFRTDPVGSFPPFQLPEKSILFVVSNQNKQMNRDEPFKPELMELGQYEVRGRDGTGAEMPKVRWRQSPTPWSASAAAAVPAPRPASCRSLDGGRLPRHKPRQKPPPTVLIPIISGQVVGRIMEISTPTSKTPPKRVFAVSDWKLGSTGNSFPSQASLA